MRWLHLTDLHVRQNGALQSTAMAQLFQHLNMDFQGALDLVIVSGDLTFSGQEDEFRAFEEQVLKSLIALDGNPKIVVVPGNHDVNCSATAPTSWQAIGHAYREKFFDESALGEQARRVQALGFAPFDQFVARNKILSVDISKNASSLHVIETSKGKVNLLLTNTAFFSHKSRDADENGQIPAPLASLRTVALAADTAVPTIVVGHHPISWFLKDDVEPFRSFLQQHNALYIHGHEHRFQASSIPTGLLTLGFGATYAGNPDAPTTPVYRNSFAVCDARENLHISAMQWVPEAGRWATPDGLPVDFVQKSALVPGAYELKMQSKGTRPIDPIHSGRRTFPSVSKVLPARKIEDDAWKSLLVAFGLVRPELRNSIQLIIAESDLTRTAFRIETAKGLQRVDCISGVGHVLSERQIETMNTFVDTEGVVQYSLVTLGSLSDDAQTLYARLKGMKPIKVLANVHLAERGMSVLSLPQIDLVHKLDGGLVECKIVLWKEERLLLVADRTGGAWFYIANSTGAIIPESDDRVLDLRNAVPSYREMSYSIPGTAPGATTVASPSFDRTQYLEHCRREFNSIRYSGLASAGLRLANAPLEDIYVEGSADLEEQRGASRLKPALREMLDGLGIEDPFRDKIVDQMSDGLRAEPSGEAAAVRSHYQHHPTLLVLGDPGSGKTCFVKHEILAYCSPPKTEASWYANHVPVYVPLAEAAKHAVEAGLVETAVRIAVGRGAKVTVRDIDDLLSRGQVAFFFDGLDEIVSIGKRAQMLAKIDKLIQASAPTGNRFVMTSRPAAIQPADVPEQVETVMLRGLTEAEMRTLASRVLAARAEDAATAFTSKKGDLTEEDKSHVDQLIADCEKSPGIRSLARNPLLLTLLAVTYANGGRASAKRHRIYHNAIQTLVTIRNRQPGGRVLAEADLRSRLGAIALKVYTESSSSLPSKQSAIETVLSVMREEIGPATQEADAREFLQQVAEGTGIILVHEAASDLESQVSFMHHSFLEYYAALALSSQEYVKELPARARQPKWREVLSLLAGIVGDNANVGSVIQSLCTSDDGVDAITSENLLFAFDCALECDVPAEAVQRTLLSTMKDSMQKGAGRIDSEVREKLGERLCKLLVASGSQLVAAFLADGLVSEDPLELAAYIDMVGKISREANVDSLLHLLDKHCRSHDPDIRLAIVDAVGESKAMSRPGTLDVVRTLLRNPGSGKARALMSVEKSIGVASLVWDELIACLDDSRPQICCSSASIMLRSCAQVDLTTEGANPWLARALSRIGDHGPVSGIESIRLPCTREQIETLLFSKETAMRMLGLQLLPWLHSEEEFCYRHLLDSISIEKSREEVVIGLRGIRISAAARRLLRLSDVPKIVSCLRRDTRDVRIAAAKLLAQIGTEDVLSELIKYVTETKVPEEYCIGILAVVRCGKSAPSAVELCEARTTAALKAKQSPGTLVELRSTLEALCEVSIESKNLAFVSLLTATVNDFKQDDEVRRLSFAALVNLSPPGPQIVRLVCGWLDKSSNVLSTATCKACLELVRKIRTRVDFVRSAYSTLPDLKTAIIRHYEKCRLSPGPEERNRLMSLRKALEELDSLLFAFGEFEGRIRTGEPK